MEKEGFNMLDIFFFTGENLVEPDLMIIYRQPGAKMDSDRNKLKLKPKNEGPVHPIVLKEILLGEPFPLKIKNLLITHTVNKSFQEPPKSKMPHYAKIILLWYKPIEPFVPHLRCVAELTLILDHIKENGITFTFGDDF